jgi:hypothetical protein
VTRLSIVIVLSVLLAMAGCGTVDDRATAATTTAERMLEAVQNRDGATACAALAPDTAAEITESTGKGCAEAILEEDLSAPGAVRKAEVYGQRAQVRFDNDTVFLGAFPNGWRVMAAGCVPRGDRPYDCTLQGG